MFLLGLLLTTLSVPIATCTVYTVTPDDLYYPNTSCHHCHNLQHYLLNITKYFISNTQLLFLPGLHHLHTDLIIQNVHNISLIGSTANGTTLDTAIIQCNSSVGITLSNITDLTVQDILLNDCQTTSYINVTNFAMLLKDCYNVQLNRVTITGENTHYLQAVNVLGNSLFLDLTCNRLLLLYNEVNVNGKYQHNLLIKNYKIVPNDITNPYNISDSVITVHMFQYFYSVVLEVVNTKFISLLYNNHLLSLKATHNKYGNFITFKDCIFDKCQCKATIFHLESQKVTNITHLHKRRHQVKFTACQFLHCKPLLFLSCTLIKANGDLINVVLKDCIFKNITSQVLCIKNNYKLTGYFKSINHKQLELPTVLISNTTFLDVKFFYTNK